MGKFKWLRSIYPIKKANQEKRAVSEYSITDPKMNLPAGTYYIGDPCYVIKDEDWMQALNETNLFNLCESPEAVRKRELNPAHLRNGVFLYHAKDDDSPYHLAASSTEFGDGDYPCKDNGNEIGICGVDAGLVAAIPVEMIENYGQESGLELGVIHKFTQPFGIKYEDGTISFGSVTVATGNEGDDER